MKRKALIIHNPVSGTRRSERILQRLFPALAQCDINHVLIESQLSDSDYIIDRLDDNITDVIVIGGDGTLHHVLNHIKNSNVILNIIPAGTGNDFVKNIDIGKNLDSQIDTIINGKVVQVDVGQCNDRLFLNGIGIGFDGQIVSDMLNKKSWLSGHAKYYYHVLSILATFKPQLLNYRIEAEPFEEKTLLLAIANGTTYGGGFKLTPKASISDGFLNICAIGNISPLKRFMNIHKLSNGTHGTIEEVDFNQIKSIRIEKNQLMLGQIDGEFLGHPPFDIKVLPRFLNLRVKN